MINTFLVLGVRSYLPHRTAQGERDGDGGREGGGSGAEKTWNHSQHNEWKTFQFLNTTSSFRLRKFIIQIRSSAAVVGIIVSSSSGGSGSFFTPFGSYRRQQSMPAQGPPDTSISHNFVPNTAAIRNRRADTESTIKYSTFL